MPAELDYDDDSHFTVSNIPFGVVSLKTKPDDRFIATRIHSDIYSLPSLMKQGLLSGVSKEVGLALLEATLNNFASLPQSACRHVRVAIQQLFAPDASHDSRLESCKHPKSAVLNHLPVKISDFTDFSCSLDHVFNASEAMTGKRSMPPCFMHFPPGYSGRCSSIVLSGTSIKRPLGQYRDDSGIVTYGPTRQLDFELEMAAIIGQPTTRGQQVHADDATQHIFGLVLLNDWSARDIQGLEMPPLGPLNGKSFGTTISPWVVTVDALEPFACSPPLRDASIVVAPYLQQQSRTSHYSIQTQVDILHSNLSTAVCKSNFKDLYWPLSSLVAHQTSNGCPLNTGDLLGTGTISGSTPGSNGCLLESTKGGKQEIELSNGDKRRYLLDGDAVRLTAYAGELGSKSCVGFGECVGTIEGAITI